MLVWPKKWQHRHLGLLLLGLLVDPCTKLFFIAAFCPVIKVQRSTGSTLLYTIPRDLKQDIVSVATSLWGAEQLGTITGNGEKRTENNVLFGEAPFNATELAHSDRLLYFESLARKGDARAQHSLGLLLWNGYCGEQNDVTSARWHAAAAAQNHLDAIAVLGGCLRTGTGVSCDINLGLRFIDYPAGQLNPTGINKKAALEEANGNFETAFQWYQKCCEPNALLLMNLGWCYIEGSGVEKDTSKGEEYWRQSIRMAPDEGSEEAAWFLYKQLCKRNKKDEANEVLQLAALLGHDEAKYLV